MLAGLFVLGLGLAVVAVISNRGRISSEAGTELTNTGFRTQKRSACITDLRNLSENYSGEVSDAVLNRLAVLDGYDPRTGKAIPKIMGPTGKMIADPNMQKILAYGYVQKGLKARDLRQQVAKKLRQPTLNNLCGKPIVSKAAAN